MQENLNEEVLQAEAETKEAEAAENTENCEETISEAETNSCEADA